MTIRSNELANAVRFLAIDAVEAARSGHPGMPMGMADIAEVLWRHCLKHNPLNPNWINRDRFILSNGHGSMLLYALLHLTGYDLSIEDVKQFRSLGSKTPGHPEHGLTPGVETTTGPLGQGLANGVGMAIAERRLAAEFNRPDHSIIDHYTYVFAGDGCLMEGISHEVCSLAGVLNLGKLIVFWDDNMISIDGPVDGWFGDNTPQRFTAYGWHVLPEIDGHDPAAIRSAIEAAQAQKDNPSLICCKTVIGYGSPNQAGTAKTHGAPLGHEEAQAVRNNLKWPYPPFDIPDAVYHAWDAKEAGHKAETDWLKHFAAYQSAFPELAETLLNRLLGDLPDDWEALCEAFLHEQVDKAAGVATRKASRQWLDKLAPHIPGLFGGSADLTESNCTAHSTSVALKNDTIAESNYLHYGVREFGMFAIMNGLALHGGFIPYGGTFLVFSDYGRNAIRLSALMKQRVIYVLSHDSIGLGEDGPTHQPIEQASSLRLIPDVFVWRPCDAVETAVAWQMAVARNDGPSCLLLSRQSLPHQERDKTRLENIKRGGYSVFDPDGELDAMIIATGSEVALAVAAAKQLHQHKNLCVRVVSMPCVELFEQQPETYRNSVLPPSVTRRVAVEAGSCDYWYKYVGLNGQVIGLDRFGESAPGATVFSALGITVDAIVSTLTTEC